MCVSVVFKSELPHSHVLYIIKSNTGVGTHSRTDRFYSDQIKTQNVVFLLIRKINSPTWLNNGVLGAFI